MSESVFKYKPVYLDGDKILEKTMNEVIDSIVNSYYFLPTRVKLNDPFEGVVSKYKLGLELQMLKTMGKHASAANIVHARVSDLEKAIDNAKNNSGIFSLSKDKTCEIMWAHYANSHYGIVIEYDLNYLARFSPNNTQFDVNYSNKLPELRSSDIKDDAIKKVLGNKSEAWAYEQEFRIVLEGISGRIPHDYRAIKSITFGSRLNKEIKKEIYSLTKHKVGKFYHIETKDYELIEKPYMDGDFSSLCNLNDIDFDFEKEVNEEFNDDFKYTLEEIKNKIIDEVSCDPHINEVSGLGLSSIKKMRYLSHAHLFMIWILMRVKNMTTYILILNNY